MADEAVFVELLRHLNFLRVTDEDAEFMPLDQASLETGSQWSFEFDVMGESYWTEKSLFIP